MSIFLKFSSLVKVSNGIDQEFLVQELLKWKNSPQRIMQIKGELYYDNEHDILHRKRMMIGEGGELMEVLNLPNHRIIDNQYAKLVNQKANYLLGKSFTIEGENQQYVNLLKKVFNKHFMKTMKAAGKGVYFTSTKSIANGSQYKRIDGKIIEMVLSDDAKVADYLDIIIEFEKTGILKLGGKLKEDYQYIICDVGQYVAVKGYDAIALNGY